MSRPLLGCIADDFTGATDLANNLVRSGMRTVQAIGVPAEAEAVADADAIVIALKSRTVAPSEAIERSLAALRWLQARGAEQFYFKYCSTFDSTPEGNIGPVLDALLDALHGPQGGFTIACPAFPGNHRTVYKGHLFVGEQLLSESGMRHHPLTPMTDSNLVRVLQAQTRRKVGLVAHETVRRGTQAIVDAFDALRRQGVAVAVVDAISDDDLAPIGRALADMALVTAGSGVAVGLAQNWRSTGRLGDTLVADRLPPAAGWQAVVSGSCSQATNAQVARFMQDGGSAFRIDPLSIAAGEDVAAQAQAWARPRLGGGPVLVYATAEPADVKLVQERLGTAHAGELVERTLARVASGFVEAGVRQLIVAGGETSGAVVEGLGVRQMKIGPQIDPGVPWTSALASVAGAEPLHLALKSGNFGSVDFFSKAFAQLASRA